MSDSLSFQQQYYADGMCFGCGPANEHGLHINSFAGPGGAMVCDWTPGPQHQAAPDIVNGGILGLILDCHGAAAAMHQLMVRDGTDQRISVVTKDFTIRFLAPTPLGPPLHLEANVAELRTRSAAVDARVKVDGMTTVMFRGIFVVPRPGEAPDPRKSKH